MSKHNVNQGETNIFPALQNINSRPKPFEFYTTPELWNDPYISKKMLETHLNEDVDLASRNMAFVTESVNWIIDHFNITKGKKVCDFGCGPGLYTTPFAKTGADVTGVDLSKRSIDYAGKVAKEQNLNIKYVQENYLDFNTDEKFDLITLIFCDFCVLSPAQGSTLLKKFSEFLAPGGALLMDLSSISFFNAQEETGTIEHSQADGFWSPGEYFAFLNVFKYEPEKLLLHKFTVFEPGRTNTSYNWLQCYSPDSIGELLKGHGLEITETYSDVASAEYSDDSPQFAVVARKSNRK